MLAQYASDGYTSLIEHALVLETCRFAFVRLYSEDVWSRLKGFHFVFHTESFAKSRALQPNPTADRLFFAPSLFSPMRLLAILDAERGDAAAHWNRALLTNAVVESVATSSRSGTGGGPTILHVLFSETASSEYWRHMLTEMISRSGFPTVAEAEAARECTRSLLAASSGTTPADVAALVCEIRTELDVAGKPMNETLCAVVAATLLLRPGAAEKRVEYKSGPTAKERTAAAKEKRLAAHAERMQTQRAARCARVEASGGWYGGGGRGRGRGRGRGGGGAFRGRGHYRSLGRGRGHGGAAPAPAAVLDAPAIPVPGRQDSVETAAIAAAAVMDLRVESPDLDAELPTTLAEAKVAETALRRFIRAQKKKKADLAAVDPDLAEHMSKAKARLLELVAHRKTSLVPMKAQFEGVELLLTSSRAVVECYALMAGVPIDLLKAAEKTWSFKKRMPKSAFSPATPHILLTALCNLGWSQLYGLVGPNLRGAAASIFRSLHVGKLIHKAFNAQTRKEGSDSEAGLRRVSLIVSMLRSQQYPASREEFEKWEWGHRIARPLNSLLAAPAFAGAGLAGGKSAGETAQWLKQEWVPELAGRKLPKPLQSSMAARLAKRGSTRRTWVELFEEGRVRSATQVKLSMNQLIALDVPCELPEAVLAGGDVSVADLLEMQAVISRDWSVTACSAIIAKVETAVTAIESAIPSGEPGAPLPVPEQHHTDAETEVRVEMDEQVFKDKAGRTKKRAPRKYIAKAFGSKTVDGYVQMINRLLARAIETARDAAVAGAQKQVDATAAKAAMEVEQAAAAAVASGTIVAAAPVLAYVADATDAFLHHATIVATPELLKNTKRSGQPPSVPSYTQRALWRGDSISLDQLLRPEMDEEDAPSAGGGAASAAAAAADGGDGCDGSVKLLAGISWCEPKDGSLGNVDLDLSVLLFGTKANAAHDQTVKMITNVHKFISVAATDERTALFYIDGAIRQFGDSTHTVDQAVQWYFEQGMTPPDATFSVDDRLTLPDELGAAPTSPGLPGALYPQAAAAADGQWDPRWEYLDYCSYQNLKIPGCVHSGDVTSAPFPKGARETVEIDVKAMLKSYPGVRAIGASSSSSA